MKLQNVNVFKKLLVSNIVVIFAFCLAAYWLESSVTRTLRDTSGRVAELTHVVQLSKEWKGLVDANTQRAIASALSVTPSMTKLLKEQVAQHISGVTEVQKAVVKLATQPGDQDALDKIAEVRKTILADLKKIDQLKATGDGAAVEAMVGNQLQVSLTSYLNSLEEFVALQEVHRTEAMQAATAAETYAEWEGLGWMVIIALASIVSMVVVAQSIVRPLKQAVEVANGIAAGDLTQELSDDNRRDEIGVLMAALSQMSRTLRQVVAQVRHGVESVSTASTEIAAGNEDLSSRTEQAAANLEEAAASMEELTGTVAQSADSAAQASILANSAAAAATRGHEVVVDVMARMKEISESSVRIADIIGTIDSISFQTNILALNAAVEAARAGEQGRGFAVVASEVRVLATRSADAAKQIKTLIAASVEKVNSGSAMVDQTGKVMAEIESSVKRATDMMSEISAATKEQRDGIAQVNQSVTHLDEMTQQNAALVEESVAAAGALREQAASLTDLVSMFKVGDQVAAPRTVAVAAVAKRPVAQVKRMPASTAAVRSSTAGARALGQGPVSDDDWTEF